MSVSCPTIELKIQSLNLMKPPHMHCKGSKRSCLRCLANIPVKKSKEFTKLPLWDKSKFNQGTRDSKCASPYRGVGCQVLCIFLGISLCAIQNSKLYAIGYSKLFSMLCSIHKCLCYVELALCYVLFD